jgi:hypothetical protein
LDKRERNLHKEQSSHQHSFITKRISCLHHHLHFVWQQKYDILPGYPAHPVDLKTLPGHFTEWPLRNPLTMKPLPPQQAE